MGPWEQIPTIPLCSAGLAYDGCSDQEVGGQLNVILMKKNSQNSFGQFPIIHQNPIVYDPHLVFKSLIHSDKLKNNLEFICHGNMNSSCCEIRYFPLRTTSLGMFYLK